MRIFSWLTGNKDHHINISQGIHGGKFWWRIVRVEKEPRSAAPIEIDVANCPTPGYDTLEHAEEGARAFLDGIGADYLKTSPTASRRES